MENIDLNKMKLGDERIVEINAGVDEKFLKINGGKRIRKGEILRLSDEKGREYFFEVKRIIGGTYLVLSERGKKRKMSLADAFKLIYLTLTKRRL